MPRQDVPTQRNPLEQSTALALPDDIREELLRAQQASVNTPQQLPQARVMQAGVGLFKFDDTEEMVRTFEGIVLGAHDANILWERDVNTPAPTEEEKRPACSSNDGVYGIPRLGFRHAALSNEPAMGTELIACVTCPYNKFGSGDRLIPAKNKKGKAVTNQKMVYVLMEGRPVPVELVLNAMSIKGYEEYSNGLLNQGTPTVAVVTTFTQVIKEKGPSVKYGVVKFERTGTLDMDTFQKAAAIRKRHISQIMPAVETLVEAPTPERATATASVVGSIEPDDDGGTRDDDLPF
jgi:hypothetical protein